MLITFIYTWYFFLFFFLFKQSFLLLFFFYVLEYLGNISLIRSTLPEKLGSFLDLCSTCAEAFDYSGSASCAWIRTTEESEVTLKIL